jgi:hypothetical protein
LTLFIQLALLKVALHFFDRSLCSDSIKTYAWIVEVIHCFDKNGSRELNEFIGQEFKCADLLLS